MFKKIGPGVLVAAAFIGPGTITTCTIAGVDFGYALLWAMLLSLITTIVFQEMAARVGIITRQGLAGIIRKELRTPWLRNVMIFIILAAIVIGNAAYEAGNIGGAVLGLEAVIGSEYRVLYSWIIGFCAFALLYVGSYKALEKIFISLVMLMSVSFVLAAIITQPDLGEVFAGLLSPTIPKESVFTIIALVGTTVVPYNLFLHASLVSEKWKSPNDLKAVRLDTVVSLSLGGIISMAIIITAGSYQGMEVTNALDLARGLEPLYGEVAKYFMGVGLFAAGITSAITAPLAAAYVASSCFGWEKSLKSRKFRSVWIFILIVGVLSQTFQFKPIEIIKFAQIANGLLLPIVGIFLLWIINKGAVMGAYKNTIWHNILGFLLLAFIILLGGKSIFNALGSF
ncbi:MAG: Nramp family divalent metal transporter [Eudoraea sp.]|nr:Nramp family divalent metal transporter [Eudoraea sp.]